MPQDDFYKNDAKVLIALGSNLTSEHGSSSHTLQLAIDKLQSNLVTLMKSSSFYRTPCFPIGAGPDYVNAVIQIHTILSAAEILTLLHQIEADFSRQRVQRWGSRTLDLDLLAYDSQIRPDLATYMHWRDLELHDQGQVAPDQLILPHPRLQDRAFVLGPLCEIAPNWCHPVSGRSAAELYAALPDEDRHAIVRLEEPSKT